MNKKRTIQLGESICCPHLKISNVKDTKESTELQLQVAKENRKVQAKQLNQIKTMLKDM